MKAESIGPGSSFPRKSFMTEPNETSQDWRDLLCGATAERAVRILSSEWEKHDRETAPWPLETYRTAGTRLLECGHPFLAYDILAEGLQRHPEDVPLLQQQALALARLGETAKARTILSSLYRKGNLDGETLGILARTYKDQWQRTGDPQWLNTARDLYEEGFSRHGDEYTGINAAALNLLCHRGEHARSTARQVVRICLRKLEKGPSPRQVYWMWATLGEAHLILGEVRESMEAYGEAFRAGKGRYGNQATTIRQARLLLKHLASPGMDSRERAAPDG